MGALIINLPYSAYFAPVPVFKKLDLCEQDWQLENWRMVDPHLASIVDRAANFERNGHKYERPVIVYQYSPLVADPWGMLASELNRGIEKEGSPYFIRRGTTGQRFVLSSDEEKIILERTVKPYHRQIEEKTLELLEKNPLVLILTIRSFSSIPWNFETNRHYPRPQVAVGASDKFTPRGLSKMTGYLFKSFSWWAELNWPQGGVMLPPGLKGHKRVKALGLSLSRSLYMDEKNGQEKSSAGQVVRVLSTVFNLLEQEINYVSAKRLARAERKKREKLPSPVIKAKRPPK